MHSNYAETRFNKLRNKTLSILEHVEKTEKYAAIASGIMHDFWLIRYSVLLSLLTTLIDAYLQVGKSQLVLSYIIRQVVS